MREEHPRASTRVRRAARTPPRAWSRALLRELGHQPPEGFWIAEGVEPGEDSARVEAADRVERFAAKESAEDAHGEEKGRVREPLRAVERQAACGDDGVDVRMKAKVARPVSSAT